jgi:hypothetical protein
MWFSPFVLSKDPSEALALWTKLAAVYDAAECARTEDVEMHFAIA